MGSFIKGMTFTMRGDEYEVLSEESSDPSSYLVYVSTREKATAEPQSLKMWKAEAKLARGEIIINGYVNSESVPGRKEGFFVPFVDPLEQIAELKRRIRTIEESRLTLLKADDPEGHFLIYDNVVRPNKTFNIWDFTRTSGDIIKKERQIQYIKLRGLILYVASHNDLVEHFYFNIADQLQPCCRVSDNSFSTEGIIKADLSSQLQTIKGPLSQAIGALQSGHIELDVDLRLKCQYLTGMTCINAKIVQAAYVRDVNAPGLQINRLAFQELGEHTLGLEGINIDIYTGAPEERELFLNIPGGKM